MEHKCISTERELQWKFKETVTLVLKVQFQSLILNVNFKNAELIFGFSPEVEVLLHLLKYISE